MSRNDTPRDFDAVAFKRRIQADISEEVRDLSPIEEIEYFRRQAETGPLGKWWQSLKRAQTVRTPR